MGGDEQPSAVCCVNDRTQLLDGELGNERISARRADATAGPATPRKVGESFALMEHRGSVWGHLAHTSLLV